MQRDDERLLESTSRRERSEKDGVVLLQQKSCEVAGRLRSPCKIETAQVEKERSGRRQKMATLTYCRIPYVVTFHVFSVLRRL
jgi:hypothetical protein